MLPLIFKNPNDYDLIKENDEFSIKGLTSFTPNKFLILEAKHSDGSVDTIKLNHTFNESQINWFKSGSALNLIAEQSKSFKNKKRK